MEQTTPRSASSSLRTQRLTVIGGGSGCNAIISPLQDSLRTTFIVPVSDDGGSTAEILRVLGGPALGDIRSRLVRLIPLSPPESPLGCIRRLFEYRLPSEGTQSEIKMEWHTIVEGTHKLWRGFNFKKASIGNLFLSGASLFLGSVPSAIFLFASLTGIPHERFAVVPVINTSSTVTIAAELENGSIIAGQSEISHPSPSPLLPNAVSPSLLPALKPPTSTTPHHPFPPNSSYFPLTRATTPSFPEPPVLGAEEDDDSRPMDESPDPNQFSAFQFSSSSSFPSRRESDRSKNIEFSKDSEESLPPLEARISRIFYLNAFGHEIYPRPNGLFLESLQSSTSLIYAPGSLYTSILPCLALPSVGSLIATSPSLKHKILLLNTSPDRETPGYNALDFVKAISKACNRAYGDEDPENKRYWEPRDFVTSVVYLEGSKVEVEREELEALGIRTVAARATSSGLFDDDTVREALETIFST
ncbi:uncharacterized protein JCM6883_006770 [Sporobolomyces salmoneus]|uniref:uncharacterized protein n=1 Tax=Sporobolomyces salmoneus TaxID=183962 RepID=UPI00317FC34B